MPAPDYFIYRPTIQSRTIFRAGYCSGNRTNSACRRRDELIGRDSLKYLDAARKDIKSLEDVIVELQRLANAENNTKLDRAAGKLRNAFEAENKSAFVDALDDIVDELDRILDNEC